MARRAVEVRRDEILRATIDEVTVRGFAHTRVADVAASLGVSTGLVFYHFESKDALLAAAFAYAAERDLEPARRGRHRHRERRCAGCARILTLYGPEGSRRRLAAVDRRLGGTRCAARDGRGVPQRLDVRWKDTVAEVDQAGRRDRAR